MLRVGNSAGEKNMREGTSLVWLKKKKNVA